MTQGKQTFPFQKGERLGYKAGIESKSKPSRANIKSCTSMFTPGKPVAEGELQWLGQPCSVDSLAQWL